MLSNYLEHMNMECAHAVQQTLLFSAATALVATLAATTFTLGQCAWHAARDYAIGRVVTHVQVRHTSFEIRTWLREMFSQLEHNSDKTRFELSLACDLTGEVVRGCEFMWLPQKGHWCANDFEGHRIYARTSASKSSHGVDEHVVDLFCFGKKRCVVERFVREARRKYIHRIENKTRVLVLGNDCHGWRELPPRTSRPLNSVFLPDALRSTLTDDVKRFLDREEWYHKLGIPYRRGYLFHGPPGTGKTSTVMAIAGQFHLPVHVVSLGLRTLEDAGLLRLVSDTRRPSIVLLEDVDTVSCTRRRAPEVAADTGPREQPACGVTLGGLLNVLDGAVMMEGILVFLTTNRRSMLDPALLRPGRIDVSSEFSFASAAQIQKFFSHFYSLAPDASSCAIGSTLGGRGMSMAQVQAHCMRHPTPEDAVRAAKTSVANVMSGSGQGC